MRVRCHAMSFKCISIFSLDLNSSIDSPLNLFGHKTWNVLWISFLYLDLLSRIFHLHLFKELNAGELFVERRQEYITEKRKGKERFLSAEWGCKMTTRKCGDGWGSIFIYSRYRFWKTASRRKVGVIDNVTTQKSVVAEGLGHSFCLWILFVFLVGWFEKGLNLSFFFNVFYAIDSKWVMKQISFVLIFLLVVWFKDLGPNGF